MFSLVLMMDYRRFETGFSQLSNHIKDHISKRIKGNELVLEGFASYIAGMNSFSEERAKLYAENIVQRFPHIFMLEVAEGVDAADLQNVVQRQRNQGYPEFSVKAFDYSENREWRTLPKLERYYPLIFIHPLLEESRPVLGLDMASHEHLLAPLKRAITTGSYQTSLPFRLIEGDDAYVMFMPVHSDKKVTGSSDGTLSLSAPKYLTLIVLRAEQLFSQIEELLPKNAGLLVYHSDTLPNDPAGQLFNRPASENGLMPKLSYNCSLEDGRQGFVILLERRFGVTDISFDMLLLTLVASILLFFGMRLFVLKRYQADMVRVKRDAQLELLAKYDALTSLPNRNLLMEWLEESLRDLDTESSVAVLYLDLDDFKQLNDRYGHTTGDEVLRTVADRIHQTLRKDDFAVRMGGDEFVVLITHFDAQENVSLVVEKLQHNIEAPMEIRNLIIKTRVSIGVSFYPDSTDNPHELIDLADKVMYQVKRSRGRRV